ncbi:major facilitator superfamily domain-containing protein [Biscogniauxia mediterranea]|nr:major facilitator superfamily domain-containing protein [Biscogniauxia mediterranea]
MDTELKKSPNVEDYDTAFTEPIQQSKDGFNYISGWKLHLITTGLLLGLFLINFEITIVSTAVVSITNDFGNFAKSSWIITSYLITYVAFLVIWAKVSDLIGRKVACNIAVILFTAFSAGCGAAQTMDQLIICRAFQGLGGAGMYSVFTVMIYELVPPPKYPLYTASAIALIALANAIGPLFGGLISERSTWRWVFLLNIPTGIVSGSLLLFTVPADFPNQGRVEPKKKLLMKQVDFVGAFLMLAAVALVITGLEQAASTLSWTTAEVLGPLSASAFAWIAFFACQYWHESHPESPVEAVFPWRFCKSRVVLGLILITFIFQIPLRYQTAGALDPLQAGIRLLPFSLSGPIGSIFSAGISKRLRVPPLYLMFLGSIMQIIGIIFTSRGSPGDYNWSGLYGLEVVVGLGFGFCLGASTLLTPFVLEKRDLAVGTAATVQFRFLGGAAVVSIVTAVGNSWIRDRLSNSLTPLQIQAVFQSSETIRTLPANIQDLVRMTFSENFNLQMKIVLGFAVAGAITPLLMWRRAQVQVE